MGAQSRALLKTWFETGDTPTQAQFADLIDSYVSIKDDLLTSGTIKYAAITLQVADLKALNSSPFDLITAPGAGLYIRPISIDYRMVYATTPYATNINPDIRIDTANDALFTGPFNWLGANATMFNQMPRQAGTVSQVQYVLNKALQMYDGAGDATAGDSLLELFILYQLISA